MYKSGGLSGNSEQNQRGFRVNEIELKSDTAAAGSPADKPHPPATHLAPSLMSQLQPRRKETDVNGKPLVMIIKGLFRRYQRWNPVHPTLGTFWGMGIGLGCGVGWGPGFGPEVIGYVGAGCGVGFSVGITLAGVGVGLPQNGLLQIPLRAFITGGGDSSQSAKSYALTTMKGMAEDGLNYVAPHISFWRKETSGRLSSFRTNIHFDHRVKLTKLSKTLSMHIQSSLECFEAFKDQCWPPRRGA